MKVLVACEFSGVVRDAFIRHGHDAVSCDLLPSESDFGPHIQGDAIPLMRQEWDMVIAFPPCTYLTNARALPDMENIHEAIAFFLACQEANAPMVAVENPTPFKYAREFIGEPDWIVEPYMFGAPYKKRTCLWLRGLPPLIPQFTGANVNEITRWVEAGSAYRGKKKQKFMSFRRADRSKNNSKTFPEIAEAMAVQWGNYA